MAVGAAGLQSAYADQPTDIISPKFWNISATLRGFYDDNYTVTSEKRGSAGVEFNPSISINVPLKQTDFGVRYNYGLYYYQQREDLGVDPIDQTHQVDFWLDHSFNERVKANVTDTFAVGQEPELLNPDPAKADTPLRIEGNNIANHGSIKVNTEWTRLFSTAFTYNNGFFDYENSGATVNDLIPAGSYYQNSKNGSFQGPSALGNAPGASSAGILDRIEQSVSLDLQWTLQPETVAFIGYSFSWVNYTGNEPISAFLEVLPNKYFIYHSSDRDNCSHYGYLGITHQFTPNLSTAIRGGAAYTDSYNDPLFPSTSWTPYADISANYTYLPGSYVQIGFTHDISTSDQVNPDASGHITQYAESSVVYADINHRFTKKLIGSVIGRCQYSTFDGGAASTGSETSYGLGLNLHYEINQHFGVDAGYNYDKLTSGSVVTDGSSERNRVYLGLMASY